MSSGLVVVVEDGWGVGRGDAGASIFQCLFKPIFKKIYPHS